MSLVKNVAIVGHASKGKTTLAEAMLNVAGATERMGKVADGNTLSDYGKEEQKRQENLRREAEKSARQRAKQEDEERSRIEKARQQAEGKVLETGGQAKPGDHVQLVMPDKKKQEESRREAEEELKRIRERNARMMKNDPKLLEEEQKRLKELMEKNRRR